MGSCINSNTRYHFKRDFLYTIVSYTVMHSNLCSIVWGFSCKSNIDSLQTVPKNAMRAVMSGYVKYYYKDGVLPKYIKSAFKITIHWQCRVLSPKNALIFMGKILRFTSDMPRSIRKLIPSTSPSHDASMHETSLQWIDEYDNAKYRNSVFLRPTIA